MLHPPHDGSGAAARRCRTERARWPSEPTHILALTQTGLIGTLVAIAGRRITKRYVALEAAGLKERSEHHARRSP
jgi:hypothetical protein